MLKYPHINPNIFQMRFLQLFLVESQFILDNIGNCRGYHAGTIKLFHPKHGQQKLRMFLGIIPMTIMQLEQQFMLA